MDKASSYRGERIELRGIGAEDAGDIVRWRSDPANFAMFLNQRPISMAEHLEWFGRYLDDDTRYDFVIVERSSGLAVGTAGLSSIDRDAGACEMSYMLGERWARGRGYATEAVGLLCEVAKDELEMRTVEARILPQNAPSMGVVGRAGFEESYRVYRRRLA